MTVEPNLDISDPNLVELHKLLRFYKKEAERCKEAKAYLAGCIMAGSAMETSLVLMVNAYQDEVVSTNKSPQKKNKIKPLLEWNLSELLRVAKAANWLPYQLEISDPWSHKKAKIGDYAEVVRQLRNLAHPGRYVQDNHKKRITNRHLELSLDIYRYVNEWLGYKIEKEIINKI